MFTKALNAAIVLETVGRLFVFLLVIYATFLRSAAPPVTVFQLDAILLLLLFENWIHSAFSSLFVCFVLVSGLLLLFHIHPDTVIGPWMSVQHVNKYKTKFYCYHYYYYYYYYYWLQGRWRFRSQERSPQSFYIICCCCHYYYYLMLC
jgi:hypothetical protein